MFGFRSPLWRQNSANGIASRTTSRYWLSKATRSLYEGLSRGQAARAIVWQTTINLTLKWACKCCTRVSIFEPTISGLASRGQRSLEPISKITISGCTFLTLWRLNTFILSTVRPPTPWNAIWADSDKSRLFLTLLSTLWAMNAAKRRTKEWPRIRTLGLGMIATKTREYTQLWFSKERRSEIFQEQACQMQTLLETLNSQSVRSGDKEDELEEHASSYRSKWKRGYVLFRLNSWLLPNNQSIVS